MPFSISGQRLFAAEYVIRVLLSHHNPQMEYVVSLLKRIKNKQTRESTTKNYLSVWRHLNRFIMSRL